MNKLNSMLLEMITPDGRKVDPPESSKTRFPFLMGVELELENVNTTLPPAGWVTHNDPSLRNGIEFVTGVPMSGSKLSRALGAFYASGITSRNSPRTSTHIHVNASDMSVGQLRTMFALSYVTETVLFDLIGRTRKYCGYCMPLREMAPQRLRSFMTATTWPTLSHALGGRNEDKYYGFNINSVRKHGTVEFRYFAGGPSQDELSHWLNYCVGVKKLALNVSFEDFLNLPSPEALVDLLETYLGGWAADLIGMQGPHSLFDALQELSALLPDAENPAREDELVFISEPLLSLVRIYMKMDDKHPEWVRFSTRAKQLQVMTQRVWMEMFNALSIHRRQEEFDTPNSRMKVALRELQGIHPANPFRPYNNEEL